jgi:hypothetical protein
MVAKRADSEILACRFDEERKCWYDVEVDAGAGRRGLPPLMRSVVARTAAPGFSALERLVLSTEAVYAELLEARVAELKTRRPQHEPDILRMRDEYLRLGPLSWTVDGRNRGEWGLDELFVRSETGVVAGETLGVERSVGVSGLLEIRAEDTEAAMFEELGSDGEESWADTGPDSAVADDVIDGGEVLPSLQDGWCTIRKLLPVEHFVPPRQAFLVEEEVKRNARLMSFEGVEECSGLAEICEVVVKELRTLVSGGRSMRSRQVTTPCFGEVAAGAGGADC